MPTRKTQFQDNSYYHLANRGIDNRTIFTDHIDYHNFYITLAYYLSSFQEAPQKGAMSRTGLAHTGLFQNKIQLVAYCLTPSSYHLLFHQAGRDDIKNLMGRVGTAYSMNFNRRHRRSGPLFQGRYKAKWIDTQDYLLQSTKYIHRIPFTELNWTGGLADFEHSSYYHYLHAKDPGYKATRPLDHLINPDPVLDHFHATHPDQNFSHFTEQVPFVDWYQELLEWMK